MAVVWALGTILLLALQDADVDRLIEDLGSEVPETRENAFRNLRARGNSAYAELERFQDSRDAEIRSRVRLLLRECEHNQTQAELDKNEPVLERLQRSKKLGVITIEAENEPYETFLRRLSEVTGLTYYDYRPRAGLRVNLKARNIPLNQAFLQLGSDVKTFSTFAVVGDASPAPNPVYFEGGRFSFSHMPWVVGGRIDGFVFTTIAAQDFGGDLEWTISDITTTRSLELETCPEHSPGLVYARGADLSNPVVKVRAVRRWYTDSVITFRNPADPNGFRCGSFEIALRWPSVVIRSGKPVPVSILEKSLAAQDIRFTLKVPAAANTPTEEHGVRSSRGPVVRVTPPSAPSWCGCLRWLVDIKEAPETSREWEVPIGSGANHHAVDEIHSVVVTFHRPVEETFEVYSPPLK